MKTLVSHICLVAGVLALASPLFFYWWLHGNYERYLRIINMPAPYANFGSGPYQLVAFGILPIVVGMLLIAISLTVRRCVVVDEGRV